MDPFQMVVIIVLISVGAGTINNYIKMKHSRAADDASDAEFEKMANEVSRLKERVRVLEKIVTDGDKRLSEEISRLA
jgi:cell division protein FtsB